MSIAILPVQDDPALSRAQWLAARQKGIGGSEIGAILGLSPFESPIDVYCRKLGLTDEKPETRPMRLGKLLEPVILAEYQQETGRRGRLSSDLFTLPEFHVLGTPDGFHADGIDEDGLEFKAVGLRQAPSWGDPGTDEIPDHYLVQVALYMALTKRDRWHVAALIGGQELRCYTVHRDPDLEATILDGAARFWVDHILAQEPPPIDGSESARRMIESRFPRQTSPLRPASIEEETLVAQLAEARRAVARAEADEARLQNLIKAAIGEGEGLQGPDWKVTWKATKDSSKTDWKAVVDHINPKPTNFDALVKGATTTKPGVRRFLPSGPLFSEE